MAAVRGDMDPAVDVIWWKRRIIVRRRDNCTPGAHCGFVDDVRVRGRLDFTVALHGSYPQTQHDRRVPLRCAEDKLWLEDTPVT